MTLGWPACTDPRGHIAPLHLLVGEQVPVWATTTRDGLNKVGVSQYSSNSEGMGKELADDEYDDEAGGRADNEAYDEADDETDDEADDDADDEANDEANDEADDDAKDEANDECNEATGLGSSSLSCVV